MPYAVRGRFTTNGCNRARLGQYSYIADCDYALTWQPRHRAAIFATEEEARDAIAEVMSGPWQDVPDPETIEVFGCSESDDAIDAHIGGQ